MQRHGVLDQSMGAIQHGYGQVKEKAKTLVEGASALDQLQTPPANLGIGSTRR